MARSRAMLLLLAASTVAVVARGVAAECRAGGCLLLAEPVCGSDGLVYMNECFAACQGVKVTEVGGCGGTGGADVSVAGLTPAMFGVAAAAGTAAATVSEATIKAYEAEGLRMVGLLKPAAFKPAMPVLSEDMLPAMQRAQQRPGTTMMVDSHGHLYAAPPSAAATVGAAAALQPAVAEIAASEGAAPQAEPEDGAPGADLFDVAEAVAAGAAGDRRLLGFDRAAAARGRRQLVGLFGRDTRSEVHVTPRYPFSAAGHLMFTSPEDDQRYQCSGALVGPYAVLTAAHCVVARSGEVQADITFTPGQTARNASGLGVSRGVRVYFNSEYLGKDWTGWDMGIVVIDRPFGVASADAYEAALEQQPARRGWSRGSSGLRAWPPGSLGYATSPPLDGTLLLAMGYPGDKPLGSAWQIQCRLTDDQPERPVVPNRCPIVSGQSGSALVERRRNSSGRSKYYVRAVVSFEMCRSVCSGACCGGEASFNGALKVTPFFQGFIDSHRNAPPYAD